MANELVVRLVGDTKDLERSLARAGSRTSAFSKVAKTAGLALAGGLAFGIGKAISTAADFEQSLNVLQAVSGATGEQMKDVSALAKELGADMTLPATSAKDAADAMVELSKGGLSVKDTMAAAKGVLQLSAAAQIENAEAAEITADALNAFNLSGKEANRVADLLAASANATTASIEEMAQALQQSSAVAHQMDIPIQDLTAVLGEMANAGIKGSDAGTSVKTMLNRLLPTTEKAKQAVNKLGIDLFDAQGNFVGIRSAIAQYSKALRKLTPEQRKQAIQTIFGSDAQRAASIILGGGVKAFDKMRESVTKQGAASKLATAQTKGFKGAMEAFKSALETLAITFGTQLLPILTTVMQHFSRFATFLEKHPTLLKVLVAAVAALATALLAASAAQTLLNLAMFANPIGAVVLAVAALAAGFVILYKKSEKFRAAVNFLREHWRLLLFAFGLLPGIIVQIVKHWETFKRIGGAVISFVKERWQDFLAIIPNANPLIERVRQVLGTIKAVASDIKRIGTNAFNALKSAADSAAGVLSTVNGWIQSIISSVSSLISWISRIDFPDPPGWLSRAGSFVGGVVNPDPRNALGGTVRSTGRAIVHAGEAIVPARVARGGQGATYSSGGRGEVWFIGRGDAAFAAALQSLNARHMRSNGGRAIW